MGLGPFDLGGSAFLTLYGVLLVVAVIAGIVIPRWLRPEGGAPRTSDVDQLAYLAGGATRLADAVVARLLAAGSLVLEGKSKFHVTGGARGDTPAEREVLKLASPATLAQVQRAATRGAPEVADKLVRAGLLIDSGTAWQLRLLQTAPYLLLLVFGAIKWEVGVSRERPVGYLTALLVGTAVLALVRFLAVERRTRAGLAALGSARDGAERLRRAPVSAETGMAVALFGTVVLTGSALGDYHALRASSGDGGSYGGDSGSSGGDGGGSGCGGGGGCGGCGS